MSKRDQPWSEKKQGNKKELVTTWLNMVTQTWFH